MIGPAWTCHARPAALGGRTCGYVNAGGGIMGPVRQGERLVCCADCGCTKIASDHREREAATAADRPRVARALPR